MRKLKILLLCSIIFFLRLQFLPKSSYSGKENQIIGTIVSKQVDGNLMTLEVKGKEKILVHYYYKTLDELEHDAYQIGDFIQIKGILSSPSKNRNFYLFHYKNYLKSKQIYWIMQAEELLLLRKNKTIFYTIKNNFFKEIKKRKHSDYLLLFIMGDSSMLSNSSKANYQTLGISHLFAISGMHIGLLTSILLKLIKKKSKNPKIHFIILLPCLSFYAFLTNFSPSVLRASFFCLLLLFQKIIKKSFPSYFILLILFFVMILYNPYYCYNVGFLFSYLVTFTLIFFQNHFQNARYLKKLWITSWLSFVIGIPLVIQNFSTVNFLSPIWNLFFIPYVSILLFPCCLLIFIFPFLYPILDILIEILERVSHLITQIQIATVSFPYLSDIMVVILTIFIFYMIFSYFQKKRFLVLLFVLFLLFHYHVRIFDPNYYMTLIDVGQGDAILLELPYQKGTILIDTGGKMNYSKENWQTKETTSLTVSTIIPCLKARGVHKLNYLILTHGDYDHMGEAIDLVNNFKVDTVILNHGKYNDLEKEFINVLDQKNMKYYKNLKELNIEKYKFEFLNTKEYENENDNSNVIYFNYNDYKFLLMGDAGIEKEKDILDAYNLKEIDFLKVGHHGSNTSSSKAFIDSVKPKYSFISVGKNNRYGHPKNETLNTLSNSKIYRTDRDGSIEIKLNKNGYTIKTCSP